LAALADGEGRRTAVTAFLPYIPERQLYAAVLFAPKMIREGTPPGLANWKAARHYGVSTSDVAHYTGLVAGRAKGARGRRRDYGDLGPRFR
jgi:hypothetical protein